MTEISVLISAFVDPIALIMALVLAASVLRRKDLSSFQFELAVGALFALAIVYSMSHPFPIFGAGIMDMRFLFIGTATAFIGPIAGITTVVTATTYRLIIGGVGVAPGLLGIAIVFAAALFWRRYIKDCALPGWQRALALGVIMTLHSLSIFLAPPHLWGVLFTQLMPYMLATNVVGALLIKQLLFNEFLFHAEAENHRTEASVDHLTGLKNRRSLEQSYAKVASKALQRGQGLSLLYFDVDEFKSVNDRYGHATGDEVLRAIAERLGPVLRANDVFARLSGDEFVIVLPEIGADEAAMIAERCRRTIADQKVLAEDSEISVTISIGAIWLNQDLPIQEALRKADRSLYSAKEQGRNFVVFSRPKAADPAGPHPKAA